MSSRVFQAYKTERRGVFCNAVNRPKCLLLAIHSGAGWTANLFQHYPHWNKVLFAVRWTMIASRWSRIWRIWSFWTIHISYVLDYNGRSEITFIRKAHQVDWLSRLLATHVSSRHEIMRPVVAKSHLRQEANSQRLSPEDRRLCTFCCPEWQSNRLVVEKVSKIAWPWLMPTSSTIVQRNVN